MADERNRESLWRATARMPERDALSKDAHADVVVVGAGIAGLSCAYVLASRGRSVVVIDEAGIGAGQTGLTTAHLATGLDDRYFELERLHGERGARLAAESHAQAIATIEGIVRSEAIDCDFERVPGCLIRGAGDGDADVLEREYAAAQRAGAGVSDVAPLRWLDRPLGSALRFEDQAQFHPLRYLAGLAEASLRRRVRLYTNTRAVEIRGGASAGVTTAAGQRIDAGAVVVATNVPINDRVVIHTKQAAYRTFVIALPLAQAVEPLLLWDTDDPYHYVRTWRDRDGGTDWLIVGGEDHKTGQPPPDEAATFRLLQAWTLEQFGVSADIGYAWSGQVIEPNDGLAFIGRNPLDDDNVYIVTGDSGNGMTHGTLAALLIADLIEGRANPWAELYAPARKQWHGIGEFVRENGNVVAQYADLATPGDVKNAAAIARGDAAILRRGLHKIAAYRDEHGNLHAHSAYCTHLGCIVHWNSIERSWDCPCHGSRFDPVDGSVRNGPAVAPLAPAHTLDEGEERAA